MVIIKKIKVLLRIIISELFRSLLNTKKNIAIEKGVFFNKIPDITVIKGSTLFIDKDVTVNSNNKGYHINMYARCKILIDRPGANVSIGMNSRIHGVCIHAYKSILIGKNCLIAANTQIIDGNGHNLSMENPQNRVNTLGDSKPIKIEDNVWIGAGCFIMPGVTIGQGSVISAGSVVKNDIPPLSIAIGNPAVVINKVKKHKTVL